MKSLTQLQLRANLLQHERQLTRLPMPEQTTTRNSMASSRMLLRAAACSQSRHGRNMTVKHSRFECNLTRLASPDPRALGTLRRSWTCPGRFFHGAQVQPAPLDAWTTSSVTTTQHSFDSAAICNQLSDTWDTPKGVNTITHLLGPQSSTSTLTPAPLRESQPWRVCWMAQLASTTPLNTWDTSRVTATAGCLIAQPTLTGQRQYWPEVG